MTEAEIEIILQGAKEKYPDETPDHIGQGVHSDLGNDACPDLAVYPQSNRKIERWHKSLKGSASGRERRYRSMMRSVR